MSSFRYRDEESTSSGMLFLAAGALAGIAAGVLVAQRFGGFSGLAEKLRGRFASASDDGIESGLREVDGFEETDEMLDESLEERVLEAFSNDPILSERAIDIGAIGEGIIELSGWVHADAESTHAVTVTRGTPGVVTVVNRLAVRTEEEQLKDNARRFAAGDPALTEARWEGQQVGTGRRRQGTSDEYDRHADPKVSLEDRWLDEKTAERNAAEEIAAIAAERRKSHKKAAPKGDRTGGAPVAPTGVPKADHVADPESARESMRDENGRDTHRAD
jgi:hypothetical protein